MAPRRTLERRAASGQPLSIEEADRAVRIARTAALAQQVFSGKADYAQEWLRTKQPGAWRPRASAGASQRIGRPALSKRSCSASSTASSPNVIVWRFSQHASLDGRGGLFASGRWHTRGHEILYCAPNPATALLEVLVHGAVRNPAAFSNFQFLKIDVPDSLPIERADEAQLPTGWLLRLESTRAVGDRWLREGKAVMLTVRSVLVPETFNALINPRHAQASQLQLIHAFTYPMDPRLFKSPLP